MKKKLMAALLALTLACLALPGALAQDAEEGQTYTLEELGLTVTLPEELIVLAPGIVPEETAAEKMDWTVGDVKDWYADLEALDIYLAAVPWGVNWELDLGATYDEENSWYDFRSVPKAGRQHLMDKMMENSGQNGLYWESVSPYEADQALFSVLPVLMKPARRSCAITRRAPGGISGSTCSTSMTRSTNGRRISSRICWILPGFPGDRKSLLPKDACGR